MRNAYETGRHVYLRAVEPEDADGPWHEWFSDPEVTRYLIDQNLPNTRARQRDFASAAAAAVASPAPASLVLAVIERETGRHVGIASMSRIHWVYRFADVAVVIGDADARSRAVIGFEAFALLLRAAFLRLNLLHVRGSHVDGHDAIKEMLRLMRFKEIGRFQRLCHIDGVDRDIVLFQLGRAEWLARNLPGGSVRP